MDARLYIVLFLIFFSCSNDVKKNVTFGLLTDLHFAHREDKGNRCYNESFKKATIAMKDFNSFQLDFIVELGDLKDQSEKPNKKETISFLKEIDSLLISYGKPVYHVLGNHDMDNISKNEYLLNTSNPKGCKGKNYYSFKCNGYKFIVLDGNYNLDQTDYDSGNFNWEEAIIPDHEFNWLKNELEKGEEPIIVFIHQLLDNESNLYKGLYIRNADEVNELLVKSNRVLAVFQGHHHDGGYSYQNGIHYFTMKGMIEGKLPDNNSYAIVEIYSNGDIVVDGFCLCQDKVMRNASIQN